MARKTGVIRNWNASKGFGFARPDDGTKDVFVHCTEIRGRSGRVNLPDGTRVEFDITDSPKGPRAVDVAEVE